MLKIKINPPLAVVFFVCVLLVLRAQKAPKTEAEGGRILFFSIYLFSKKIESTKISPHLL